jgi:hypothetical protein
MRHRFRGARAVVLAVLCGSYLAVAAPAKKEKEAPAGPITPEQLEESENNLKQILLAYHNYHDTYGVMPTNQLSKDQKPLLSWRVQILPFIEQEQLYKQFKLDEPWDSEHNKKLIDKMPKLYAPVRVKADPGMTYYQAFGGSHGWLKPGARLASFTDGTSNTFGCAEAAKPVIWTKPEDMVFDGKKVPALGGLFDGRFHAAMCDGSVRRFRKGADPDVLKLLIDPGDGNPIPDLEKLLDPAEEKK